MTGREAPHLVAFGLAEQPDRGQGRGELGRARAGQRPQVPEDEPDRARLLPQGERVPAGDQQLAHPAAEQGGQVRVADGPPARLTGQVVVEVLQDDEVGLGRAGTLIREGRRRHLAAHDGDDPAGLQPPDPRGDLRRERRLADAAHAVDDQAAAAWSAEVGGPAAAFGRTDGQGRPGVLGAGRQLRRPGVASGVPDPDRAPGGRGGIAGWLRLPGRRYLVRPARGP